MKINKELMQIRHLPNEIRKHIINQQKVMAAQEVCLWAVIIQLLIVSIYLLLQK